MSHAGKAILFRQEGRKDGSRWPAKEIRKASRRAKAISLPVRALAFGPTKESDMKSIGQINHSSLSTTWDTRLPRWGAGYEGMETEFERAALAVLLHVLDAMTEAGIQPAAMAQALREGGTVEEVCAVRAVELSAGFAPIDAPTFELDGITPSDLEAVPAEMYSALASVFPLPPVGLLPKPNRLLCPLETPWGASCTRDFNHPGPCEP